MLKTIMAGAVSLYALTAWGASPASASPDTCSVRFTIGTNTTALFDLGTVAATLVPPKSKRQKCKERAVTNCNRAEIKTMVQAYAPVGSANFQNICAAGYADVYYDTTVENHTNSKDGYCKFLVSCTRPPCPYTGYSMLDENGGSMIVDVKFGDADATKCQNSSSMEPTL